MRKKRKLIRFILIIAIAVAGFFGWQKFHQEILVTDGNSRNIDDLSNLWNADKEVAAAKEKLAKSPEEALVITTKIDNKPEVAIVFDGLPDRILTAKLIDILQKYDSKAAFFAEGQNAGEDIETMKLIAESGQQVGNYTFVGVSHVEKLPVDSLLTELCTAQKVINLQMARTPTMFRAHHSEYTSDVLKAVNAAGIETAVKSNVTIDMNEINSLNDAIKVAAPIPFGSIIAIQIGHPVEIPVQESGKTDERPAIDKKPTVVDPKEKNIQHTADTATRLEWLLLALGQRGIKAVDVASFRKIKYVPAAAPQLANNNGNNTANKTPDTAKR